MGRPRLAEIQKAFQTSWATAGRVSISAVWDSRHLLVIFDSEDDVRVALASPLNKVGHALFRLFRWHPDYNPKRESAITTIWVRLPGLPISIYDPAFIKAIVSTFGYFVAVDDRTKACTALNVARACVELDVTKGIPDAVWINMPDDRSYWQAVEVDSKIAFCRKCRLHGHNIESCRKRKTPNPTGSKNGARPAMREEPTVVKGNSEAPLNKDGAEKEWQEVVPRKRRSKILSQSDPDVGSQSEKDKVEVKTVSESSTDSNLEKALVLYGKGGKSDRLSGLGQNAQKGVKMKNTLLSFNNVTPNDLSGAEFKIRNGPKNVLLYDDVLGIMFNPNHMAHYNQIQKKAGSMRKAQSVCDEIKVVRDDTPEEGCSTSSKHCSFQVSQ